MKIMAFDIASYTGVALGCPGETPRTTVIDLGKERSQEARFAKAIKSARYLLAKHTPDLVVYEAPIGGKIKSDFLIGAAACFRGQFKLSGARVERLQIAKVRKHFLGRHITTRDFPHMKKDAAKAEIKRHVVARCHQIGWKVGSDDEADAAACWDFACATFARAQVPPSGGLFGH